MEIGILVQRHDQVRTAVSARLNVVRGVERTNQIFTLGRSPHMIGLQRIIARLYLAGCHSMGSHNPSNFVGFACQGKLFLDPLA